MISLRQRRSVQLVIGEAIFSYFCRTIVPSSWPGMKLPCWNIAATADAFNMRLYWRTLMAPLEYLSAWAPSSAMCLCRICNSCNQKYIWRRSFAYLDLAKTTVAPVSQSWFWGFCFRRSTTYFREGQDFSVNLTVGCLYFCFCLGQNALWVSFKNLYNRTLYDCHSSKWTFWIAAKNIVQVPFRLPQL